MATLALVLITAVAIWRLATEATPPLHIRRTLPAYVRLPGAAHACLATRRSGRCGGGGSGQLRLVRGSTPAPIASVAKVMTAYLTLREHPLTPGGQGFAVTITPADVAEEAQRVALGESTLSVSAGERIAERQALQALLLPSANNIAALLARSRRGRGGGVRGPHELDRAQARHGLDHVHRPERLQR